MNAIIVEWFDAQSSLEQLTIEEAKTIKPLKTVSCGFLAHSCNEYILLCFTDFNNGTYKHWQMIPTKMIISKKQL